MPENKAEPCADDDYEGVPVELIDDADPEDEVNADG